MSFITRNHNQTIVYWANPVADGRGGHTFDAPVEVQGKWEDSQKRVIDADGNESLSESVIYVGQDMEAGEWVFLGALADIPSSEDDTNPGDVTGSRQIVRFNKIPNMAADDFERRAFLGA